MPWAALREMLLTLCSSSYTSREQTHSTASTVLSAWGTSWGSRPISAVCVGMGLHWLRQAGQQPWMALLLSQVGGSVSANKVTLGGGLRWDEMGNLKSMLCNEAPQWEMFLSRLRHSGHCHTLVSLDGSLPYSISSFSHVVRALTPSF